LVTGEIPGTSLLAGGALITSHSSSHTAPGIETETFLFEKLVPPQIFGEAMKDSEPNPARLRYALVLRDRTDSGVFLRADSSSLPFSMDLPQQSVQAVRVSISAVESLSWTK
jgi:hypothetical protein